MKEEVRTSILPYARPEPRPKYKSRVEIIPIAIMLLGVFVYGLSVTYAELYFMEGCLCTCVGLALVVLIRSRARSVLAWIGLWLGFFLAIMGTTTNF